MPGPLRRSSGSLVLLAAMLLSCADASQSDALARAYLQALWAGDIGEALTMTEDPLRSAMTSAEWTPYFRSLSELGPPTETSRTHFRKQASAMTRTGVTSELRSAYVTRWEDCELSHELVIARTPEGDRDLRITGHHVRSTKPCGLLGIFAVEGTGAVEQDAAGDAPEP